MTLKFSKALAPLNLADTCEIPLTPSFKVNILQAAGHNQLYHARVAAMGARFPDHPIKEPKSQFWMDALTGKLTADTAAFLCHVVLTGWSGLTDNDGNDVPFSAEAAEDVLASDGPNRVIASKLLSATFTQANFTLGDTLKN